MGGPAGVTNHELFTDSAVSACLSSAGRIGITHSEQGQLADIKLCFVHGKSLILVKSPQPSLSLCLGRWKFSALDLGRKGSTQILPSHTSAAGFPARAREPQVSR